MRLVTFLEALQDVADKAEIGRRNLRRAVPEPMRPLDPFMRLPALGPNGGAAGYAAVRDYRIAFVLEPSIKRSYLEIQRLRCVPHDELRPCRQYGAPDLSVVRPHRGHRSEAIEGGSSRYLASTYFRIFPLRS